MKKNKNIFKVSLILMLAFIMLLSTAGCAGKSSGGAGSLKKVVVRLKWVNQAQFAGFYAAKEKGYYKDAGLDVDIRPGGSDFPAVQMVTSGSEDFGVTGADQVLLSRAQGAEIVAVSVIYRQTPFSIMTLKKSGITSMKDLVGKKVAVKLGGNEELTYRLMLKEAGVSAKLVEEVPVKYDISPLLSGQVAAFPGYAINETLAAEEQGYPVNEIKPSDYNINLYADTLFTTQKIIDKDPDMVKAFTQATMKGWDYAIKNPDEAAALGLKYDKQLKIDHEKAMMKASLPYLSAGEDKLGVMDEKAWSKLQDELVETGFLKENQKSDINKAFTNKYVQ